MSTASSAPGASSRVAGLDGLRGLAAVFVVGCHVLVASSTEFEPFFVGRHAGQEWVIVFFVLSGFVLSVAAADGADFDAARYYPARLLRLYIPVWAALVFAAAVHELVDHSQVPGATGWLNAHAEGWSWAATAKELTLVFGAGDYYYTTALWSLRPEVLFSLLLPAYLLVAARAPLRLTVAVTLVAMLIIGDDHLFVYYMLTFVLGVALAFRRERVTALMSRTGLRLPALLLSPFLLTAIWWMPDGRPQQLALVLVAVGAATLVALGMSPGPFTRLLETRPLQAVGRRSFSLYLLHEPIVVAVAFALGGEPTTILLVACSAPFVAAATVVFYRYVERPSHGMSRRAGATASEAVGRALPRPRVSTLDG